MATEIAATAPTPAGIAPVTPVATDDVNGNTVRNSRGLHLVFENTDAGAQTVTIETSAKVSGYAVADQVLNLAAGQVLHVGDLSTRAFGAVVTFTSSSALVTVAAYRTN